VNDRINLKIRRTEQKEYLLEGDHILILLMNCIEPSIGVLC